MKISPQLLGRHDPAPFLIHNAASDTPLLIVVDHASNLIPAALHDLGLNAEQRSRHIAWDIGAGAVAEGLADRLSAPMLAAQYSRLVIDCNRYPGDDASIVAISDGVAVPGNAALTVIDRERREQEIFRPYHQALAEQLDKMLQRGIRPILLSLHSMTDSLNGSRRSQDITVCWTGDDPIGARALALLQAQGELQVGDNMPYALEIGVDFTVPEQAMTRQLPYLMIELRQDNLASHEGIARWTALLSDLLQQLLAEQATVQHKR